MKFVNLLVKPASGLCNMRCRYCFYEDESAHRLTKNMGIMTEDTSRVLIQRAFAAVSPGGCVNFSFQGGEPTLAGLDFFRQFVKTVAAFRPAGCTVNYAIQTNGLLLDEAWADFLKQNGFLVGVSLDGTQALHDTNRIDATGNGTSERVMQGITLLQKAQVEVNLLCVVTKQCAKNPVRVYKALKQIGIRYLQLIPCLDPIEQKRGAMPYSLRPEDYASFLCRLFDAWYQDWRAGQYVSIRLFDDYIHLAMGLPAGTCSTCGSCGSYFVVEADGSVYPCDFYALDPWKMGNIHDNDLQQLQSGDVAEQFAKEGRIHPQECAQCRWYRLCNGGCKRDWYQVNGRKQNYYCPAFRQFFAYAAPKMAMIVQTEAARRSHM